MGNCLFSPIIPSIPFDSTSPNSKMKKKSIVWSLKASANQNKSQACKSQAKVNEANGELVNAFEYKVKLKSNNMSVVWNKSIKASANPNKSV
jgi:hypothetical protein